ncbi:ketopantoate reductase, partial [Glonium stellatum]
MPVFDRRIHIMGIGNVGRFVAYALRGIPDPPPITLIFYRRQTFNEWNEGPKQIRIKTRDVVEVRSGFDAELAIPQRRSHGQEIMYEDNNILYTSKTAPNSEAFQPATPQALEGESNEPIHALILCCKSTQVLSALSAIQHRLTPHSVILFLQNGMGTVDEVNEQLFPDPADRPFYMVGINSHGVNSDPADQFATTHAGHGTIALGLLPHAHDQTSTAYDPVPRFAPGASTPS